MKFCVLSPGMHSRQINWILHCQVLNKLKSLKVSCYIFRWVAGYQGLIEPPRGHITYVHGKIQDVAPMKNKG